MQLYFLLLSSMGSNRNLRYKGLGVYRYPECEQSSLRESCSKCELIHLYHDLQTENALWGKVRVKTQSP